MPTAPQSRARRKSLAQYRRDARPDTLDFRDLMYTPTLVEVPVERPLDLYRKVGVPILDQGREGACTGFGLAAVVHCLLRTRRVTRDTAPVSPSMLYAMAKRYDEWPGERYEGSSARGAMKGWHKHGVCGLSHWKPGGKGKQASVLTDARAVDARTRPLGAYFRVNHKDLVAMHAAIAEVGILYATASVHSGWDKVGPDGRIPFETRDEGGHAFAIVGYDRDGFWIQNSWGDDWGRDGFCHVTYDDWLVNGTDVWVARLGVPVTLVAGEAGTARSAMAARGSSYTWNDLRPHVVSLGNDGRLRPEGTYGTSKEDVEAIVGSDFPRITRGWKTKRILLYAHGGLTSESGALQRIADVRETLLAAEVYPLAFVWKTDYWTTLTNALRDATQKRPEGISTPPTMLDRLDDMLEPIARTLTGKLGGRDEGERHRRNRRRRQRAPVGGRPGEAVGRRAASSVTARAASCTPRWWRCSRPRVASRGVRSRGRRGSAPRSRPARCGHRRARPSSSRTATCRPSTQGGFVASGSSRSPIAPNGTTTAATSTTSRCSTSCRTRSRPSRASRSRRSRASRCSAWSTGSRRTRRWRGSSAAGTRTSTG
jgi:hypothetical protein